jgi:hypothetical protein
MLQPKKKIVKNPVDGYKKMKDPATGKKGTMGGEGTRPPFEKGEKRAVPNPMEMARKNAMKKKAKNGTSLGMKSVKSGYDNNSGVTRADFVAIGKGTAKSGTKMKKAQYGGKAASMVPPMKKGGTVKKAMMGTMAKPMMKSGGSMKKCKYGCK